MAYRQHRSAALGRLRQSAPHLVRQHPVALDSAGFTAARTYRGFPWDTRDYLALAAAASWAWWASQDWCVEPEVAHDEDAILDRISGTVRLNRPCLNGGEQRAIADRFVSVLQGWNAWHDLRCLDRMPWVVDSQLVGIGSVCRRHLHGPNGVMHLLDVLDRAFTGSAARFHLFGLKSQAISIACQHPRVASADSQAYGVAARQTAYRTRTSRSNRALAEMMSSWYQQQLAAISHVRPMPPTPRWEPDGPAEPDNPADARIAAAMEELRELHEAGEIDWQDLSLQAALEMAFMDD